MATTFITPFSPIAQRRAYDDQPLQQPAIQLSEPVQAALDVLRSQETYWGRVKTRCFKCLSAPGVLNNLDENQLRELLSHVAELAIQHQDPELVQHCLDSISLERFSQVTANSLHDDIDETIKTLNLSMEETQGCNNYSESISQQLKFTSTRMLDVIVNPFAFYSVYSDPITHWDASQRIGVYVQVIAAPFLFLTLMSSLLASSALAVGVTLITVSVVALGLLGYVFWWRPIPEEAYKFEHMTNPAKCQGMQEIISGEEKVNEIVNLLRTRINVLLIADAGSGKSTLSNEIFRQMGLGLIPELRDKKVLAGNAGDLIHKPGVLETRTPLELFLNRIAINAPEIIICIEDLHRMTEDKPAWNKILQETDPTFSQRKLNSAWAYFAITTTKGYETLINSITPGELERRLRPVYLDKMDKNTVITILNRIARQNFSELTIQDGAMSTLVERTKALYPDRAHPDAPIKELQKTLTALRHGKTDPTIIKGLAALNQRREEARIQYNEAVGTDNERSKKEAYLKASEEYKACKELENRAMAVHERYTSLKFKSASFKQYIANLARQIVLSPEGPTKDALKKNIQLSLGYIRPILDQKANEFKEQVIQRRHDLKARLLREQDAKLADDHADPYELTIDLVTRMIPNP